MDEYIGVCMSILNGYVPITKRTYICLGKICESDFFDACENDGEFFEYYFRSGRVVIWDKFMAIEYAIKKLSSKMFEQILVASEIDEYPITCNYMPYYSALVMISEHYFRFRDINDDCRFTVTVSGFKMLEMEKFLFAAGFKCNEMEHSRREYRRDPKYRNPRIL